MAAVRRRRWWGRRRPGGTGRRPRARVAWWVGIPLVVVVLGAAGVVYAAPTVAATICPGCHGMAELSPNVYVERDLPVARRRQVADVVRAAEQRVRAFYGGRESAPRILACTTADCYRRIGGGGERGVAVLNRAVLLSPRGLDPVIASHELSHVEFHTRLGPDAGEVPQWFDEGLAVVVADDPRYLAPASAADRCRVEPDATLPVTLDEWLRAASADEQVYARSACRVVRWVDANGGRRAVLTLIRRLAAGADFATLVPPTTHD